ncbi:MAG: peptidoglycan editing factor PgeF [Gracilimonas sp.]|uniref:peptidoglycan editing factor PgeF n=1 Tax=Gracilimonas TaxID=649462 RepID=UPI001B029AC6|nr:peptidoglycan editing factor PgeF [Gracilimonas sp.]MBO6586464.1 peptidoglycan editing factor PgeF [Gracilimonas sp.]MBO6615121.1 peptidoglycan editing factor PgeF [Gracilimonas sp.]
MSFRIKLIKPNLLNNDSVSSWFTLRNQESVHPNRAIPGLNLGLNTAEKASAVLENRQRLLKEIGLDENQIAYGVQVHKTDIKEVIEGGIYEGTDGFVTTKSGLALAIQVADCAAVLLADSENKVIAAAHAGWRGAVADIVPKTIRKMKALGAEPEYIKVYVSPCISLQNFEVGEEVATEFPDRFVDRTNYAKPHVNLKAFIRQQLIDEGIESDHIEIDDSCTIEDENYYSYRRQKDNSGRMMGIIKLN